MTADEDRAVPPDTEAVREALAYLQPSMHGPGIENEIRFDREAQRHAASIVRAALARDVPAGRDLTAQDVRDALGAGFMPQTPHQVADHLNRIARGDQ